MPRQWSAVVALILVLAACSAAPERTASGRSVESGPSTPTATATASRSAGPARASAPDEEELPAYLASVQPIGRALRDRMRFSHSPGCPLGWAELRHLRFGFVGFDGEAHMGEMVIHRDHAVAVAEAFEQLYEARWPIRQVRLVDDFEGDDDRSMAANNTSGYNCRRVAGSSSWSEHAYGAAIDINPVQNPYVTRTSVAPPAGRPFASIDRSAGRALPIGVIGEDDVVVRAFEGIGWQWGGDWSDSKDYQHFSATGR